MMRFRRPKTIRVAPRGPMTITHRGPADAHEVHWTVRDLESGRNLMIVMPRAGAWLPLAQSLTALNERIEAAHKEASERESASMARMQAAVERHQLRMAERIIRKKLSARQDALDYRLMRHRTSVPAQQLNSLLEQAFIGGV